MKTYHTPRKYYFFVTVTAEDGSHPHRFYGLDAKTGNRAIAYASKQLGREFCAAIPDDAWLENNELAGESVDDFGRVITIGHNWGAGGGILPRAKPVCSAARLARRCQIDDCDGGHCRICGGHFMNHYFGVSGEYTCDVCQREQDQPDYNAATHRDECADMSNPDGSGFDPRAPFPHGSDPHWSDPEADHAHW